VVVNIGHPPDSDALETVIGSTMADNFPAVLRDPVDDSNTLLAASAATASAHRLHAAATELPGRLQHLAKRQAQRLEPRLPGGTVYTDDRAPVEWLVDRSIVGYAADR